MAVIRIYEDGHWADTCPIVAGKIRGCRAQLGYQGMSESDAVYAAIEQAIQEGDAFVRAQGLTFTWEIEYRLDIDFAGPRPPRADVERLISDCGDVEYDSRHSRLFAADAPDVVWCAWRKIRANWPDAMAFNPERPTPRDGQDADSPPDWLL